MTGLCGACLASACPVCRAGTGEAVRSGIFNSGLGLNVLVTVLPFWDGLFHAFTWLTTAAGLLLLWKAGANPAVPWSGRTTLGAMGLGWGVFNLVEGAIDHYMPGIHHVVERLGLSAWDAAFLASGGVLAGAGVWLIAAAADSARALTRE